MMQQKRKTRKHTTIIYKTKIRPLSFLMVLLLLFALTPPVSFASDEENLAAEDALSTEETVAEESYTYTEIPEMRENYTKHFRRSDGKMVAVVYPEVMHTEKDGEMVNVDNRLTFDQSLGKYQTANDEFAVSFAPSAASDNAVGITFEGYTLSWRVDVLRDSLTVSPINMSATVENASLREPVQERASLASVAAVSDVAIQDLDTRNTFSKEDITSTFASTSGLRYENAFTGNGKVDLRYTVSHNRVEEDIIVKEKGNIRSYVMQITSPGLTATLGADSRMMQVTVFSRLVRRGCAMRRMNILLILRSSLFKRAIQSSWSTRLMPRG